tara:strand:+ start:2735 stop:3115 length:381 start_codon:yes stop_codon:yes gene_type:complete
MKKKEVFKTVATHLLKQNKQCVDEDGNECRYREGSGIFQQSCAIGVLIDDDHYEELLLEGKDGDHPAVIRAVEGSLKTSITNKDRQLLLSLQSIHDYDPETAWRKKLNALAQATFNKDLEDLGVSV